MANKNFGRRMVDEDLITKIGQGGGGGTPIEAGTGINITGTDTKTIAIDNTVVATKTDLTDYATEADVASAIEDLEDDFSMVEIEEYFPDFSDCTIDTSDNTLDISNIINNMPILSSALTTDYDQLPNPKFNTPDRDDDATKSFYFRGMCLMKDTANDGYIIVSTVQSFLPKWGDEYDYSAYRSVRKLFQKSGTDNFYVFQSRTNKFEQVYFNNDTMNVNNLKINGVTVPRENVRLLRVNPNEASGMYISPRLGYQGEMAQITFNYGNANSAQLNTSTNFVNQIRVPATEGEYMLKATVNANGLLNKFEWLAPQSGGSVYEYAVYFEFQKTGTGSGYYSVYFNLKSSTEYDPQDIDFSTLRSLIIANGDHVACTCQSQASLNMNIISTSSNAGDDTILVDSKSADYFEFMSFNELENYSITKLNY